MPLNIVQSRTELEQHSVEGSSTSDSVSFITFVQSLKRKLKNWEKVMEVSTSASKLHTVKRPLPVCDP